MADLSRRLGERVARHAAVDPGAKAESRRAALRAYDIARGRRLRLALGFGIGATAGAILGAVLPMIGPLDAQPAAPSSMAAAQPEPMSPAEMMAMPAPPPAEPMPPAAPPAPEPVTAQAAPVAAPVAAPAPAPEPVQATVAAASEPPPSETPALRPEEVKEVQAKLRSFGFNPGPVDGNLGPMTQGAVMHYQQVRGQPQTGKADRDLLEQLRQDPTPPVQVVQRTARPAGSRALRPSSRRSDDPFEPVRAAGDRLGRWLDSLVR